jgi:putative membrane protein
MVKDHENDVSAFQKEADKGKDSELTSWAKQTLPTLQDHLKMARDAETKVKGG